MTDEAEYTSSNIKVLKGLEAVRKRPGMYIGSTDARGLHHLVWEVVDNSIDEAMAGHADYIELTILADGSIRSSDDGRGVPVGTQKQTGKSALEVVHTVLHAGGKFGGGGYKVSGGLHGVGVSCVNALSEWLEATVRRQGKVYRQRYEQGVPTGPVEEVKALPRGHQDETGTRTVFRFDPTIFKDAEGYRYDTLRQRFREMAFVTKAVTIRFRDERQSPAREMTFYFEGGITSFVRYLNRNRGELHPVVYLEREVNGIGVEVAVQYSDSYAESVYSFANTIHTVDGGTHLTGFKSAYTSVLNNYAKAKSLVKKGDPAPTGEDFLEQGLRGDDELSG